MVLENLNKLFDDFRSSKGALESGAPAETLLANRDEIKNLYDFLKALPDDDEQIAFLSCLTRNWNHSFHAFHLIGSEYFVNGAPRTATRYYKESIRLNPQYTRAYRALGNALRVIGEVDEAIAVYRNALQISPDRNLHSRLMLAMNYSEKLTPAEIADEHKCWGRMYFGDQPQRYTFSEEKMNADKPLLTVGYVSPDFKSHPVAYFIQPILGHHHRNRFRIICYHTTKGADGITRRIMKLSDMWREAAGLTADKLADQIVSDDVDILVDLAGHTSGNRLDVFARRPAPVALTYLGYPNTTGLNAIDYRLTDAWCDPVGPADEWHSEKLIRLGTGFLAFEPPGDNIEISETPGIKSGYVTFGSFNKFSKLSRSTIETWVRILRTVPSARLLLKTGGLEELGEKMRAVRCFLDAGLDDPERITIMDMVPSRTEHLKLYSTVDIALDTFPYNGTTTTFQALWMGVPVISLIGASHVARVGGSVLHRLGLERLIAKSVEEYVKIAQTLAADIKAVNKLRHSLRPMMKASPLMQYDDFVSSLEDVYRTIWQGRCNE